MANIDYPTPARRRLQVFAFDPLITQTAEAARYVTVDIANEPLLPGPQGSRIQVIDYDTAARTLYQPVDLDAPAVLMNGGLSPAESDPRFHQQMVYAVAMKVVENFELALGRKIAFHLGKRLRIFPHAFPGANAFYDPALVSILFGYFRADSDDPGGNLPGQNVFTCLSHDIIAHEVTHALIHRLRARFNDASNRDVLAFHEGFADIVAIFQHFTFPDVLTETIQNTRGNLREAGPMISLAEQFGYATGQGCALRSAIDSPDPKRYATVLEPHERGSILVAAVFDAFFRVYQRRIRDLIRIATGGSGLLPQGDLHPDLVGRIERESAKTAQNVLIMCIRAIEYLPPVDVTFGDFLRALVTADFETVPEDGVGLRASMIEAFRVRGIYPDGVRSLAEESLILPNMEADNLRVNLRVYQERLSASSKMFERTGRGSLNVREGRTNSKWAKTLTAWAAKNAERLSLDPSQKPVVDGFHTVFRVAPSGRLIVELVARFTQHDPVAVRDPAYGGVHFRGGTTVIAGGDGVVRYVIAKPMTDARRKAQREYVAKLDDSDALLAWTATDGYGANRMQARTRFRALHASI